MQALVERMRAMEIAEEEKRLQRKMTLAEQQEHVRRQMEEKERRRRLQAQQDFLEVKLMQKEESKYAEKVQELLRAPAPETQFRRKAAQW
jgi:hypothetical protein